jgi:GAF domain-containing protein/HAMP domain-containing protein
MTTSYDKPNETEKNSISGNLWGRGRLRDRIIILMIVAISPVLLIYSYINVTAEQQDLEDVLLARAEAIAISGAVYIETSIEQAIENGLLTTEDVFDENYEKFFELDITKYPDIQDNPAIYDKFQTSYDSFTDKNWQRFLDSNLTGPEILYAVGSDRNGYVPTHNSIFSTGDGDPGTDRTKRIFTDEVGITASRNTEGILRQAYQQTGTGETLWDVSMPIYVNGQHWGAFRVGIALAENQVLIQNATNRAVIATSILLIVVGVFALFLGSYITQPIERLTTAAQKAATGDFNTVIDIPNRNEITILANTFNQMTSQIREFISNLEQQVTERTQALATSAEISRRLSTIVEQDELVSEVVEQLKSGFNYYHAHIYLLSESGDRLLMAGGTGEAGKILLEREHSIMLGRGLVGRVAESKETLLVPNTRLDSDWLPNPLLPDTQSEIAVPIMIGEQVLGVLDVQNDTADSLTQQDADLIRAVADQVGIALQNIRSAEAITKRAAELQTVAAISTSISTIQNVEEMLQSVVSLTQRRFGLYHAHVFLYEEDADQLAIVACGYKEGDEHEGTHGTTTIPLSQEQSLVARAARTREPVIVNDVRSDPGWLPNPLLPDTAAELAVPMIVGDQLLGVLDVQAEHTDAFTQEDASIQTTLASQVAIAVQNARSFAQTRQQAERESILNTLTQKIQNTTSVAEALQITARELGHALGKKPTLVSLDAPSKAPKQEKSAS